MVCVDRAASGLVVVAAGVPKKARTHDPKHFTIQLLRSLQQLATEAGPAERSSYHVHVQVREQCSG
jgi:hypothetical protein